MSNPTPNLIYSGLNGNHCNTHDDLAYANAYGTPCIGGESIDVTGDNAISLNPPSNARKAHMIIESDVTAAQNKVVARFRICGNEPTPNEGFPLGDMATVCIGHPSNLQNFKVISLDSNHVHKLSIIYF
jgi:hypothetical protein